MSQSNQPDDIDEFVDLVSSRPWQDELSGSKEYANPRRTGRLQRVEEKPEEEKSLSIDICQWQYLGDGNWQTAGPTRPTLPVGVYSCKQTSRGLVYRQREIKTDGIIRFEDGVSNMLIAQIRKFWGIPSEQFQQFDYLRKRGFLLYGPPGSGKTITVQMAIQDIIQMGGTVFLAEELNATTQGIQEFRKVEQDRPVICIFEDLDDLAHDQGEAELLSLLDGEQTVNNIVFIATTNYPERLNARLVNRPSRFDLVVKIPMPDEKIRRQYLETKHVQPHELEQWVQDTEGFGFAHMKELVISVKLLGNQYETEAARVRKMNRLSFKHGNDVGFSK